MINLEFKFRKLKNLNNEGIVKIITANNLCASNSMEGAIALAEKQLKSGEKIKWNNVLILNLYQTAIKIGNELNQFDNNRIKLIKKLKKRHEKLNTEYSIPISKINALVDIKDSYNLFDKGNPFSIGQSLYRIQKEFRKDFNDLTYALILDIEEIYEYLQKFIYEERDFIERFKDKYKKLLTLTSITFIISILIFLTLHFNLIKFLPKEYKFPELKLGITIGQVIHLLLIISNAILLILNLIKVVKYRSETKRKPIEQIEAWQKPLENLKSILDK